MSKFTPGKWVVHKYQNRQELRVQTEKGFMTKTICLIADGDDRLANAQAIAALPELVKACKLAHLCIKERWSDLSNAEFELQQALAKAGMEV